MIEDYGIDWRVAYPILTLALVVVGFGLLWAVRAWIDSMFRSS
jgi:hypothetical protein